MKYNFMRFPGGKAKAVTLSYDDGSKSDLKLLEIINKYNMKCTFNLVGNTVANEKSLRKDEIREHILDAGHEIANHGYEHRAQDRIRPIEGIREILDSRLLLEKEFGIIVRGMAYPDVGIHRLTQPEAYQSIKANLQALDIAYVRTVGGDNDTFALPEDWYCWVPTAHHINPAVMDYIDKFVALNVSALYRASRNARIFFLWGHSTEFERDKNWDLLEKICQKLSGREDTWYATNMEIYDYATAYASLIYSADNALVYNPTLRELWFDIDETLYRIKPGETLRL